MWTALTSCLHVEQTEMEMTARHSRVQYCINASTTQLIQYQRPQMIRMNRIDGPQKKTTTEDYILFALQYYFEVLY
jgi:hypothetical protein